MSTSPPSNPDKGSLFRHITEGAWLPGVILNEVKNPYVLRRGDSSVPLRGPQNDSIF